MPSETIQEIIIDQLLSSPAGEKLREAMDVISSVQRHFVALTSDEDSKQLKLLRIGTVFQIFLIDTLASGKKAGELTAEDWKAIASKVSQYAILQDGEGYSEFVFTLYASYIEISADALSPIGKKESLASIKNLSSAIRQKTERLRNGEISEAAYVEDCLWLSLEGMIKLLSASLTQLVGPEFSQLAEAVSQLAFEYGRYVLYAREQALLEEYIRNQYVLDEELQREYEAFLAELRENAESFRALIDAAFTPQLHEALLQSAALARAAGVPEEELLTTVDEVDDYFLA